MKTLKISLYLLLFCFICLTFSYAQKSDISKARKILISVVMTEDNVGLDTTQVSKLKDKVIQSLGSFGLGGVDYTNGIDFILVPKIIIQNSSVVEGGMENISVVTGELSLFIQQVSTKIIFASYTNQIKGSGSSKAEAIDNLISRVSTNNPQIKSFL